MYVCVCVCIYIYRKRESVHFAGLLDIHNVLSADTGISRKTENHSFGDHLISGSVSVKLSSVIETAIFLWSVSL
jgi:hypothetical protein